MHKYFCEKGYQTKHGICGYSGFLEDLNQVTLRYSYINCLQRQHHYAVNFMMKNNLCLEIDRKCLQDLSH